MIEYLPPGEQWDMTLLNDLLDEVEHGSVNILVIPGRYWFDKLDEINRKIESYDNLLVIVTGDEEALFPTEQLEHSNMIVWVQSPHADSPRYADRYFPIGYTPKSRSDLTKPDKSLRWFFGGQVTHSRRKKCVRQLRQMSNGVLVETEGFNQGLEPEIYNLNMRSAYTIPCPSGAVIPDTFRLYEALEAGCVPIADNRDPLGGNRNYFQFLFDTDELPFPTIEEWADLPGTTDYFVDTFPRYQNKCFGWWQKQKWLLKRNLQTDINKLRKEQPIGDTTTVLIPTSPIGSHPDTAIIEETIASVRFHLPEAEILIMIDGVRPQQEHYRTRYEQYVNRLLWITNREKNIIPILFTEHQHQAKMTRETLKLVDTPTILFVEHDTPLVVDYQIPMKELTQTILDDKADVVRFHHEAAIHPEHEHLMVDEHPENLFLPMLRTAQWSQRPHLASTEYYRKLISENIHQDAKTMIEDAVHGITQEKWLKQGRPGWNQHRMWIYAPEENMKRSYHLDGRGDDPKFEMEGL